MNQFTERASITVQTFGSRLHRLMAVNGISEEEVVVQTSIEHSVFTRWAAGEVQAGASDITVLAEYFGCDEHWLATGEGEPYLAAAGGDKTADAQLPVDEPPFWATRVSDKALQEIAEWIAEQQDGINYGEVVKARLARDYPEFREWLKKRHRGGS